MGSWRAIRNVDINQKPKVIAGSTLGYKSMSNSLLQKEVPSTGKVTLPPISSIINESVQDRVSEMAPGSLHGYNNFGLNGSSIANEKSRGVFMPTLTSLREYSPHQMGGLGGMPLFSRFSVPDVYFVGRTNNYTVQPPPYITGERNGVYVSPRESVGGHSELAYEDGTLNSSRVPSVSSYPEDRSSRSSTSSKSDRESSPTQGKRKTRNNLPKETAYILLKWLSEHLNHPYPNSQEKNQLKMSTGLNHQQLLNWFINARRRKIKMMKEHKRLNK